jgi:uncharacterized protein YdhG (YjbR/CyaY superfamily)
MAQKDSTSVDDYIAAQPADVQPTLRRVRASIRKAMPGADEMLTYKIPTYKVNGAAAIYFAGWKAHYSIYPATRTLIAAFATELEPYEISKGTIRFPYDAKVPSGLIGRLAAFRAREAASSAGAKKKASARPKARARLKGRG